MLSNEKESVLQNDQLTRHGKNWREMMDERCEEDNAEYDRWASRFKTLSSSTYYISSFF